MAQWQTADAKQRFTQLVATAEEEGPQVVMRHKEAVAVVLSAEDYRRLVRQADASFAALLASSPFEAGDLDGMTAALADERDGREPRSETHGRPCVGCGD